MDAAEDLHRLLSDSSAVSRGVLILSPNTRDMAFEEWSNHEGGIVLVQCAVQRRTAGAATSGTGARDVGQSSGGPQQEQEQGTTLVTRGGRQGGGGEGRGTIVAKDAMDRMTSANLS